MNKLHLSGYQIDAVIKMASHCWEANKDFKGKTRKQYFLEDLRRFLYMDDSGHKEDVCPSCLGSGYYTRLRGGGDE